ncbi:class I SAM-dependent methyltransferase [Rivularia sp. PCC 7116]|uniref:class I SAM-dependent methyltransferase n=1 Tax=Rivularia sp. PCC 7116 TaxID=373994 RepID=UPI001E5A9CFF|nr:class I SAM-dependent methyltransferase [Rivularia sp. PCC 7116]
MNYGYVDLSPDVNNLELSAEEREEIYCAQLYHHVANAVPLNGCDVLEVGCGRGGGSSYIMRSLEPKTMTGIDFSEKNIAFCQKLDVISGLNFCVGDAELLPFTDSSFDVVVNIESSHCYAAVEKCFDEVFRVIRPRGYFLFADFRPSNVIDNIRKSLEISGFKVIKDGLITENVLKAMDLDNTRRLTVISQDIPKYLQGIARWFAESKDSPIYEEFKNRKSEYFCYVLQKP